MEVARYRPAPRVSVITIFWNAGSYLEEAIESVLAQLYRDFELILVDDGSTDGSRRIAERYAGRYPRRVRLIDHLGCMNRGMSVSRNLGLSRAQGEFVCFIDADDRWRPTKLREQVELLDRIPEADALCGSVNYWRSHSGGRDAIIHTGHRRGGLIRAPEAALKMYPIGRATAPSMSDIMFRRDAIAAVGGFEDAFTDAYEDQAFLVKFYLQRSLFVTRSVWSDYRLHPASCMAQVEREGTYFEKRRAFLDWFDHFLEFSPHRSNAALQAALDVAVQHCSNETQPVGAWQAFRARLSALTKLQQAPAVELFDEPAPAFKPSRSAGGS